MQASIPVYITGLGAVSPVGNTVAEYWAGLCAGRDGIGPLTVIDVPDFHFQQAGEVRDLEVSDERLAGIPVDDRAARFAAVAALEAWQQAGLTDGAGAAVVMATNFGSIGVLEKRLGAETMPGAGQFGFTNAGDQIAAMFGCSGPRSCLSLSCSSGAAAIGYGAELIRSGQANCVIAGGYDAISKFAWAGLGVLRTMTGDKIRPFDVKRAGTLFAEGAGVLVLESGESVAERGGVPLAELAGFGCNNNAFHMTAPPKEGQGLADAMRLALADAGITPEQVDHVNTHGTGTVYNDATETAAVRAVLGQHAEGVPLTSIKSMIGHTMGAAGALEAIASVMTIRTGIIPPTINLDEQDPACDLPVVFPAALERDVGTVLTNSSGIGGNNAAVLLRACN